LGGEKLKRINSALAVLCTAAILFVSISRLSAQEQDPPSLGETGGVLSSETTAPETAAPGTGPGSEAGGSTARSAEAEIVLGETLPAAAPAGGGTTGSRLFAIIRMVLVLALAAAAVYGVVFFLRRSARPQNERNSRLKILTSAHLGSNRYVYVVGVGSRAWLIGAGEGGVSPISEITDQEAIDAMILEESKRGAELAASRFADFRAMLARFTGRSSFGTTDDARGPNASPFSARTLRKQRERLKGL
jgi:flagellar protein FliO/FliZ